MEAFRDMQEKRQYVRMKTVFPVEFRTVSRDGSGTPVFFQGFTSNVSAGGLCLEFKVFKDEINPAYLEPDQPIALVINPAFSSYPIKASARVIWIHRQGEGLPARYIMGVVYTDIEASARRRIVGYAKRLIWIPRIAALCGVLMLAGLLGFWWHSRQLTLRNAELVRDLVESARHKSAVSSSLLRVRERKESLDRDLVAAKTRIQDLENKIAAVTAETQKEKSVYETELAEGLAKQRAIGTELKNLRERAQHLEITYKGLEEAGRFAQSSGLRQMYSWLKSHQNLQTGLVASFEGDAALEDSGFTYDQSLACQTFLLFGDTKDAEGVLSFYDKRAESRDGAYFNGYDVSSGSVVETIVHTGPNVWLGIAALWHERRTKSGRFLPLASRIGDWVIAAQDAEGGLKGGPHESWYSTEHNMDAYAFLGMLARATGEKKYADAQGRVLTWIQKYAYSQKDGRMNRGKGDATLATDTFSWAIAALGPARLKQMELDPVAIIEFAEKQCGVTVEYSQPGDGKVKVSGFDFAKAQNVGRGGIISTEWTAQMIVSYRVLADYFRLKGETDQAEFFRRKAEFYLNELQKLIITSPSRIGQGRGCLPYASMDNADTGHGWRTPKGERTGSVAGTAYGIFAWTGYNPFDLDNKTRINEEQK
jgi:hypothetical protein